MGNKFAVTWLTVGVLALGLAAPAQAETKKATLFKELDDAFTRVAQRCLGQTFNTNKLRKQKVAGKDERTAIPADILSFDPIKDQLTSEVDYLNDESLDRRWGLIYGKSGAAWTATSDRLPTFWAKRQDINTVPFHDSERLEHNCVTLVTVAGSIDANTAIFKAATTAAVSSTSATSIYVFGGRALSPYAIALGGADYASIALSSDTPKAAYLAHLWLLYREKPALAAQDLKIPAEIKAISIYTARNAQQDAMMAAQANGGFGFGPVVGKLKTDLDANSRLLSTSQDVETAILAAPTLIDLPKPDVLAGKLEHMLKLRTVRLDNPQTIDADPFYYRAVMPHIPAALCNRAYWALTAEGDFTLSEQRLGEDDSPEGCLFEWRLQLTGVPKTAHELRLKATSIAGTGAGAATLTVQSDAIQLADRRALLQLDGPEFARIDLAATDDGAPRTQSVSYRLVEKDSARLGAINAFASKLTVTCPGADPYRPAIKALDITGMTGMRSLKLTLEYKPGFFDFVPVDTRVICDVTGTMTGTRDGASAGSAEIALPPWSFPAIREAPPAPAVATPVPG